jgi:hypothetical protein
MRNTLCRFSFSATCALLLTGIAAAGPPSATDSTPAPGGSAPSASTPGPTASDTAAPERTIYLDDTALAKMQAENPRLYARVQRILTGASVLCQAGSPSVQNVATAEADTCGMLLETSYPPKRKIHFVLGDTTYIAQVVMSSDLPRATPAVLAR